MLGAVIIAAAIVALVVWRGWGKPVLARGEWRAGAGLIGIGTVTGGGFLLIRGAWELGLTLVALGGGLIAAARSERGPAARPQGWSPAAQRFSAEEARALLGVREGADAEEVRAAYARLIRVLHPDRGGTSGLAAQLNAARDRLLKR